MIGSDVAFEIAISLPSIACLCGVPCRCCAGTGCRDARHRERPLHAAAVRRRHGPARHADRHRFQLQQFGGGLGLLCRARRTRGAGCRDRPAAGREREAESAARFARTVSAPGKIEDALPKSDKAPSTARRPAQDRDSAAERSGHGPRDVVPGAGLAAADRHGEPRAERRQRQDLSGMTAVRQISQQRRPRLRFRSSRERSISIGVQPLVGS